MRFILTLASLMSSASTLAQQATEPVVGSHVATNMNALSMIVSLLIVLAVIVAAALVLKRFNIVPTHHSELKVVTSLMVGNKEKIVVVQVGEKQLLLGVTNQQISLLETLDKPICINTQNRQEPNLPVNLMNLFKKNTNKTQ